MKVLVKGEKKANNKCFPLIKKFVEYQKSS